VAKYLLERAKGFCSETDWMRAYIEIRAFEADLTKHGIVVMKFWLLINKEKQSKLFKQREQTLPRKTGENRYPRPSGQ